MTIKEIKDNPFDVPQHGTLPKPTRPARRAPALPARDTVTAYHESPLLAAFAAIPGLDAPGGEVRLSPIDEILLSLSWNHPELRDVPVLGASVQHAPRAGEKQRDASFETRDAPGEVDQFLHQASSMDAMVMPSEENHARNVSSLYRAAIGAGLRKSLRSS